jgi:hypothetical protein
MLAKTNVCRSRGLNRLFALACGVSLMSLAVALPASAQTEPAPPSDQRQEAEQQEPMHFVDAVPTDLNERQLATERQLEEPFGSYFETPLADVLNEMGAERGVRSYIHESAVESDINGDVLVATPISGASIDENLRIILGSYECQYMITREGNLVIVSHAYAVDHPIRVTYDVSNLPQSPDEIMKILEATIEQDSWEPNGGTGVMEMMVTGGNSLLVISQTWSNHREIRQQLASISHMSANVIASPNRRPPTPADPPAVASGQSIGLTGFRIGNQIFLREESERPESRSARGLGGGVF